MSSVTDVKIVRYALEKGTNLTAGSLQRLPQDNWSLTASSGKANDWRTRQRVVLDPILKLENGKDPRVFCYVGTFWQAELTMTPLLLPMCRFKTPPCLDSKRPRVYPHAHMLKHMCAWCWYTRGRFESTHGGFQRATPHTLHRTHTTTQDTTHKTPQQHTTTTHRNRDRETEKEDKERERQRK